MIQIDSEFKALIPPLKKEEFEQLEQNILADGCRDPLTTWQGFIIDGHNRYEICTKHNIEFKTVAVDLPSREAVFDWMDENQLGRRNLTPEQMSLLRGRIYNRSKKIQGGTGAHRFQQQSGKICHSVKTSETLADKFGVSERTVRNDGKFAESVEDLKEYVPDVESRVLSGEVKKRDVIEAAANPEKAEEILKGNHLTIGTGQNEWYTPAEYIDLAKRVMGDIDLDPASCHEANKTVGARKIYTKEDDGLKHQWTGRVWLNPPYSRDLMPEFVEKLCESFKSGDVTEAILVSHNNTDTKWFQSLASHSSAICFPSKRIKFYRGEDVAAPTNGQAFFYLGHNYIGFKSLFAETGLVVSPL